ncbi:helix-turn-helix transcriptional regulator [Desulfobulbus sp. US1]|nr:XRE family transcriptional regulator [Candidatus Electrothrix sp. MAN1_4]MCW5203929.1 helix-turn-helix transcriptional regulator [Desulfobulbus sp. US4]MCW5207970.1 helix-turn-helix transcriptional regulator [Desulfobulbus sp. US2]MCW5208703.1 helix-turn-helix transcriptional regulator [Desulfobulbus sp. US1]MCW5213857.1 helix-turn-helix transcriptional regulator [Desulfobulbus sp. US5]
MAHTSIQKLRERMTPEARRRATLKAREMIAEMLISEIRREAGFTQEQVAELLGIRQPSLSKLESQDDMQISTLRRIVNALGGELEIIAHMPTGDIRIRQFAG